MDTKDLVDSPEAVADALARQIMREMGGRGGRAGRGERKRRSAEHYRAAAKKRWGRKAEAEQEEQ